jgi:hypothetical protein
LTSNLGISLFLIIAAAEGVKVYFPSEWGSDYDINTYGSPIYEVKKKHNEAAEKLGLKVVAIATGFFASVVRSTVLGGSESHSLYAFMHPRPPNLICIFDSL